MNRNHLSIFFVPMETEEELHRGGWKVDVKLFVQIFTRSYASWCRTPASPGTQVLVSCTKDKNRIGRVICKKSMPLFACAWFKVLLIFVLKNYKNSCEDQRKSYVFCRRKIAVCLFSIEVLDGTVWSMIDRVTLPINVCLVWVESVIQENKLFVKT